MGVGDRPKSLRIYHLSELSVVKGSESCQLHTRQTITEAAPVDLTVPLCMWSHEVFTIHVHIQQSIQLETRLVVPGNLLPIISSNSVVVLEVILR